MITLHLIREKLLHHKEQRQRRRESAQEGNIRHVQDHVGLSKTSFIKLVSSAPVQMGSNVVDVPHCTEVKQRQEVFSESEASGRVSADWWTHTSTHEQRGTETEVQFLCPHAVCVCVCWCDFAESVCVCVCLSNSGWPASEVSTQMTPRHGRLLSPAS